MLLGFIQDSAPVNQYCFPNLHLLGEQEIRQIIEEPQQIAMSGLSSELLKTLTNIFVSRQQSYISVSLSASPGISTSHHLSLHSCSILTASDYTCFACLPVFLPHNELQQHYCVLRAPS